MAQNCIHGLDLYIYIAVFMRFTFDLKPGCTVVRSFPLRKSHTYDSMVKKIAAFETSIHVFRHYLLSVIVKEIISQKSILHVVVINLYNILYWLYKHEESVHGTSENSYIVKSLVLK